MTISVRALPLAAATLLLIGCEEMGDWGNSERYKEDFHGNFPLNTGGTVSLENFNGSVEVFAWDQNSVEVSATKYASTKEQLNALKIDVAAGSSTSVRIRTIRPSSWRGNMGARYTIRVPRRVQLDSISTSNGSMRIEGTDGPAHLRTSNGTIRATKVHGDLDARTSNGGIEAQDLDGNANLHTSNGAIRADASRGSFEATTSNSSIVANLKDPATNWPLKLHSSNGRIELTLEASRVPDVRADTSNSSITVRLPASVNARVRAHTSHGSINTDFDLLTHGLRSKTELEGTIGSGGPVIDVSTSNGSIRITKL